LIEFTDRESIMREWDKWRSYIARGGRGSWPRDAFESLLDHFDEQLHTSPKDNQASSPHVDCFYSGGCGCNNIRLGVKLH